jgi:TRAP-type C4-dicarboxylate transport system permease small subunit
MLKLYHKFSELWFKLLSLIAVLTVVAMLGIMTIEVVRRYIFGMTFIWSDEVIRILLIFCAFFGGAAAYYKHNLVSFDLITSKLSDKLQKILLLVTNIVLSMFFIFLIYYTFIKMTAPSVVKSISTATGLTAAVPYYGIFVGLISLMIFTIDFYPELIRNVLSKNTDERRVKQC